MANKWIFLHRFFFFVSFTLVGCDKIPHILPFCSLKNGAAHMCECVFAIPFVVPFILFAFAMAKRFIRFDFSLYARAKKEMCVCLCVCEKTDEIVCWRLVEIDIREVSMLRQLYIWMSMAPFDWKSKIVSISFDWQRTTSSIFIVIFSFSDPCIDGIPIEFPHRRRHKTECNLTILSKQYFRLDVDQSNDIYNCTYVKSHVKCAACSPIVLYIVEGDVR